LYANNGAGKAKGRSGGGKKGAGEGPSRSRGGAKAGSALTLALKAAPRKSSGFDDVRTPLPLSPYSPNGPTWGSAEQLSPL